MINFLYALPFFGAFGGEVKSLSAAVKQAMQNLGFFIIIFELALFCAAVVILINFSIKIYRAWLEKQLRKLLIFLYRLQAELLLYKYNDGVKADKKLEIELSREESAGFVQDFIQRKFFIKKAGEHEIKRIQDGLNLIKAGKIDIDIQLLLVNNWIELVKSL
jgi:hypothetical protein